MKRWRNFDKGRRTKTTFTKFCFYYILPVIGILRHNGLFNFW
ncbi:MAG: hypothetical protein Q8784_02225 [Vigna little leaf phytoplasma]|nr:hypothetical protein [Vigna little leaf phytoplasma]